MAVKSKTNSDSAIHRTGYVNFINVNLFTRWSKQHRIAIFSSVFCQLFTWKDLQREWRKFYWCRCFFKRASWSLLKKRENNARLWAAFTLRPQLSKNWTLKWILVTIFMNSLAALSSSNNTRQTKSRQLTQLRWWPTSWRNTFWRCCWRNLQEKKLSFRNWRKHSSTAASTQVSLQPTRFTGYLKVFSPARSASEWTRQRTASEHHQGSGWLANGRWQTLGRDAVWLAAGHLEVPQTYHQKRWRYLWWQQRLC